MKKLSRSQLSAFWSVVLAGGLAAGACSSESPPPATSSGTGGGTNGGTATGGTATGGMPTATATGGMPTATATGGASTGSGGAATGGATTGSGGTNLRLVFPVAIFVEEMVQLFLLILRDIHQFSAHFSKVISDLVFQNGNKPCLFRRTSLKSINATQRSKKGFLNQVFGDHLILNPGISVPVELISV